MLLTEPLLDDPVPFLGEAFGSPRGCNLAPWEAEPYRLWSLEDMERFAVSPLLAVLHNVRRAEGNMIVALSTPFLEHDWSTKTAELRDALTELLNECRRISLSTALTQQIGRAINGLDFGGDDSSSAASLARVQEVCMNLVWEISAHRFYKIPEDLAYLLDDETRPYSDEVAALFSEAVPDIKAAGRCLAVGESTACVFHCMRTAERALRVLALRLQVEMRYDIEVEEWRQIIDAIEVKIREMERLPRSLEKSRQIEAYSKIAVQFRYFKDAWRNHVSHSRVSYGQIEAKSVWQHVGQFIQELALISLPPPETPATPGE